MATMKQMAVEYRIASAKLAMRIKEKEALDTPKEDINKLQGVLNVNANLKMSVFAEKECHFSPDSIQVYTALTTT